MPVRDGCAAMQKENKRVIRGQQTRICGDKNSNSKTVKRKIGRMGYTKTSTPQILI